jgi:hypothetical protein
LDSFGRPIVLEPSHVQLSSDAGLLAIRQFDERVELTQGFTQALDHSRRADLTSALLSRASAWTSWQQNGNNTGRVSPTWLQCSRQERGDVTV